jgi:transposase
VGAAVLDVAPALPPVTAFGLTAGVDWAKDDHAVAVVDHTGRQTRRFTVASTGQGLQELIRRLRADRVAEVAIERPDGVVVAALLAAGLTVVVISPKQIKNLRGRYGSAGNKDDRFDAFVLADTLRTDRAKLRPLAPDTEATVALRAAVRARKDLVIHRVSLCNQLRAHLQAFYPGPVGLFHELDGGMSLRFLTRFDCQDRADWLSPKRLAAFLKGVRYSGHTTGAAMHARLTAAPRGATGDFGAATVDVTRGLVMALRALVAQIDTLSEVIREQLAAHVDGHIFTSLPRSGTVRAARLLAEIGDARGRYPTPEALACLAGVAPSTRQSGKVKVVAFRWAVDKQLRDAVVEFAGDSRLSNPWAADLYRRARDRGHDHPHAVRVLARAWVYVIWHCWQDHQPYDPHRHGALQRLIANSPTESSTEVRRSRRR